MDYIIAILVFDINMNISSQMDYSIAILVFDINMNITEMRLISQ